VELLQQLTIPQLQTVHCYQSSALPGVPNSWSQSPVVPNFVQTEMNNQSMSWRQYKAIFRFFLYFKRVSEWNLRSRWDV